MSRSNNTDIKNPATRYFEWQGKGQFKYYDKDTKKNIEVPYPFRFIVLDQLVTIKGFCDADQSSFWSNEIRDRSLKTAQLSVKTKKGHHFTGTYEKVIKELGSQGAAYCKSVYIGYYNEDKKLVIGNLQLHGASIGAWIDFCKSNDVMKIGVQVKSHVEAKKGTTVYQVPVFEKLSITPESEAQAIALDKQLQEYLTSYFSRDIQEESVATGTATRSSETVEAKEEPKHDPSVSVTPDPVDDLPF